MPNATRGHIVVPTDQSGANKAVARIESRMTDRFGGCSTYTGSGWWMSGGNMVGEAHARIVVTSEHSEQLKDLLREEAEYVKDRLNEEAVLVEFEDVEMELI
jgi:hypothetical protein